MSSRADVGGFGADGCREPSVPRRLSRSGTGSLETDRTWQRSKNAFELLDLKAKNDEFEIRLYE